MWSIANPGSPLSYFLVLLFQVLDANTVPWGQAWGLRRQEGSRSFGKGRGHTQAPRHTRWGQRYTLSLTHPLHQLLAPNPGSAALSADSPMHPAPGVPHLSSFNEIGGLCSASPTSSPALTWFCSRPFVFIPIILTSVWRTRGLHLLPPVFGPTDSDFFLLLPWVESAAQGLFLLILIPGGWWSLSGGWGGHHRTW